MDMINANEISKSFHLGDGNTLKVLKDVSINIQKQSLTALKGRSGSGKTTLLNILGALDRPDDGEVLIDGEDIVRMSEGAREKLRAQRFGFVFQSVALIPMMSAYENVDFAMRLAGYEGDRNERAKECLSLVGLSERMHHLPQELSGGEQQRVAIARAFVHKPDVIFADEPTAELDTDMGRQVMEIFRNLIKTQKITVVMTTHDVGLMSYADQVVDMGH